MVTDTQDDAVTGATWLRKDDAAVGAGRKAGEELASPREGDTEWAHSQGVCAPKDCRLHQPT